MADQLEGARISPVKFIDQGDGSVAERLSIAEAGAAGNSAPALATNATGLIGWLRKLVDVLTGTLLVDTSSAATGAPETAVSVTTSATLVQAANASRKEARFQPTNGDIYWGTDNTVTTSNGILLQQGATQTEDRWKGAIYAIAASTVDVRRVELV